MRRKASPPGSKNASPCGKAGKRLFPSPQDAQQFLINKIIFEASSQGVRLSDTERRMLQLNLDEPESATGLPIELLKDEDGDYERKVVRLLRAAYMRAEENPNERQLFHDAVKRLQGTNHYILVMASAALRKPPGAFSFVFLIVLAIAMAAAAIAYALWKGK